MTWRYIRIKTSKSHRRGNSPSTGSIASQPALNMNNEDYGYDYDYLFKSMFDDKAWNKSLREVVIDLLIKRSNKGT